MSQERFTRGDLRLIVVALVLGAIGVAVAVRYMFVAFPEASIDFKVSRPEIERRARAFLGERGFDLKPYRQITLFRFDDTAKIYLERELGLEKANLLMASEINVWRWKVRFFKPPEKEELIVWLDPAGQLVGFEHIIEEKAKGAHLEKSQAQSVAEVFLYSRLRLNLDDYTLVEDVREERPNRLDHRFTWERKNFKAQEATYRIGISVYGDEIGKVLPFLKVPEQWERDYRRLRSRNDAFQTAATMFYIPLLIAVVVVLIRRARELRGAWKPLLLLAGVVGALTAVEILNTIPLISEVFPTSAPYKVFVAGYVIVALIAGLVLALFVTLLAAGGHVLYRESAPDKVALPRLFSLSGLRTKEFFMSTLLGYALAGLQLGLVVIFYLVARRLGAWSPADVKYSDFLSTALPWIYALTVGLVATTTEEFAFRLFAIPLLKKYLKSTWLAVLIPAFVWGFLHSNYPQQPAWCRGVEVGLVGVMFGFVFLRFGILPSLVCHYTYNAAVIGLLLLRSGDFYFLLAGGLVMDAALVPLAIAGALYWQHRRFAAEPGLFNAAFAAPGVAMEEPAPGAVPLTPAEAEVAAAAAPPVEIPAYVPLSGNQLLAAVLCGVAGIALWQLPVKRPFEFLRWQKGPSNAESIADRFLQGKGIKPNDWRRVTSLERPFQAGSAEYVRRQGGVDRVNELWSSRLALSIALWRVRYFRPLQKEEHQVFVSADGRVARYDHLLEEIAPGANLSKEEAGKRAVADLAQSHQLDVSNWKLAESKLEKRDARTDHHLVWEDPKAVSPDAYVRAEVDVRGEEVGGYHPFLKVPEEWLRELNKPRIQDPVAIFAIFLVVVGVLILGVRRLAQHPFRWRLYIGLALLLAGVNLATHLNGLRTFGSDYDTSVPWQNYVFQEASGLVGGGVGIAFLALVLVLAADIFLVSQHPQSVVLPFQASPALAYFRDAIAAGAGFALLYRGLVAAGAYFQQRFPLPRRSFGLSFGTAMDSYLPGLTSGIEGVLYAVILLALVGIVVGVLRHQLSSNFARAASLAALLGALNVGGAIGLQEFFENWAYALVLAGAFALTVRHLFRANLLAYLLCFTISPILRDILYYWEQPAAVFRNSAFVAPLTAAALLWALQSFLQRTLIQTSRRV